MAAKKNLAAPLLAALAASPGKENEVPSPYPKGPKNGVGKENEVASPYPKGPKIDSPSPFPKGPKGSGSSKKKTPQPPSRVFVTPAGRRVPFVKGF
jgi:hypothetical protein